MQDSSCCCSRSRATRYRWNIGGRPPARGKAGDPPILPRPVFCPLPSAEKRTARPARQARGAGTITKRHALLEESAGRALALDPSEGSMPRGGSPVASHRPRGAGTRQHELPKGSRPTGTLARTSSLRPTYPWGKKCGQRHSLNRRTPDPRLLCTNSECRHQEQKVTRLASTSM